MKIGIITICKVNNYGAELQAFATQKKLEQMGFDVEIIDYIYYKNWRFKDTPKSAPFIAMSLRQKIAYNLKYRCINWGIDVLLPIISTKEQYRKIRYRNFHQHIKFSPSYYSIDDLYKNTPQYDIYMTGSDQVWNPAAQSSIEPYFLTFAPRERKKISYASSFGISKLNKNLQPKFRKLLNNFDVIGVREQDGVNLVQYLCNKEAQLVIDPTLLLTRDEWKPYTKEYPNIPSEYILIYQLSDSNILAEHAIKLGNKTGLPIYRICKRSYMNKKNKDITNITDAGPQEFLSLISKANFVLTDSFHGTAFSVNFATPFYAILSTRKANNSRIESLLEKLNLKDRIIYDNNIMDLSESPLPNYSFELNKLRNQSIEFLINNINTQK